MSRTPPLVSALMPAFDAATTIGPAISSILGQTHRRLELVVVDDGSRDDTARIVESFVVRDDRVRLVRQAHGGRGRARNTALDASRGDLIAITDADDIQLPQRFETQVACFQEHPDVGVVSCQLRHFNARGEFPAPYRYPTSHEAIAARLRRGKMCLPSAAIRRACFEDVGPFDEECLRAQDLEHLLRILLHGRWRFALLDEPLLLYRTEPAATWRFWLENARFTEYAYDRYLRLSRGERPVPFETFAATLSLRWQSRQAAVWLADGLLRRIGRPRRLG